MNDETAIGQLRESLPSSANALWYTHQRFLFMTLDPVHIGAGGHRLGRVDMTIAREPGTNLPKIPGTSLAGAARSYAAMRYGKIDAAGQHKKLTSTAKQQCPIIYTFGTATEAAEGQAGTVSIGDAQILLFPVYSMAGPVWVSTPELLRETWGTGCVTLPRVNGEVVGPTDAGRIVTSLASWTKEQLNLGWILLDVTPGLTVAPSDSVATRSEWEACGNRIVLVTPKLFSQIVNSNLEVRTSVSIKPETGAAEQGALFTYEALPRATWLICDVVKDDYPKLNGGGFFETVAQCKVEVRKDAQGRDEKVYQERGGAALGEIWASPLDVVQSGFKLMELLGVGGMGTRGFGRMRVTADWEVRHATS